MHSHDQAALDFLSLVSDRFPDWEIEAGVIFPIVYVQAVEPVRLGKDGALPQRFFECQASVPEILYDPTAVDRLRRELDNQALHAWADNPA